MAETEDMAGMVQDQDLDQDLASEFEFLKAAEAYRAAKRSGDAEATRAAEEAWREQVRRELMGCS